MNRKVVIIGGGLAGLLAAIRLKKLGENPILIDSALPEANGTLGGFAMFSGAKFSLPPAGMGLVPLAGNEDKLRDVMNEISNVCELNFSSLENSSDQSSELTELREYQSLVLNPHEMEAVLNRLEKALKTLSVETLHGTAKIIALSSKTNIVEVSEASNTTLLECDAIFYAGGRLGTDTLIESGIKPTNVKGIDVGVRVEFLTPSGLYGLREHGPDAKIIKDNCRTFCLNVPGKIFRYPYKKISIPGGVVATSDSQASNVGILYRSPEKDKLLERIIFKAETLSKEMLEKPYLAKGSALGEAKVVVEELYGSDITTRIEDFCMYLQSKGLVNWAIEHLVHIPLIDWHWPTFSLERSFRTNIPTVFCLGDSSGHARGLMQAAVSGWLAAEEYAHA